MADHSAAGGGLLSRFNMVDWVIVGFLFLLALGVLLVQSGLHETSGQMVEGDAKIQYTVMLQTTRTLNTEMIKPGKSLSITIRNQPRGDVKIQSVKWERRQYPLAQPGGAVKLMDDPTVQHAYDAYVTLLDEALITKEGYVTNGIKVKIGLPIEIEGFDYRLAGTIVDVKALESTHK